MSATPQHAQHTPIGVLRVAVAVSPKSDRVVRKGGRVRHGDEW